MLGHWLVRLKVAHWDPTEGRAKTSLLLQLCRQPSLMLQLPGRATGVAGVAVSLACAALLGAAAKSYHAGEFKSRKSTDDIDDDDDEVSDSALDTDSLGVKKIPLGV